MKNKDISNFEDFSQFRYLGSHMIGTVLLKKEFFALDRLNRESAMDITKNL